MSTPAQGGGRALLSFRVLGFPVHVDWSFVLFVGLLGWQPGITLQRLGIWLLLAFLAVLAHELGHAVAARMTGAQPSIALVALGGVTTYVPPRQLSRLSSLGIALAGPVVGLDPRRRAPGGQPVGRRRARWPRRVHAPHGGLHDARLERPQPAAHRAARRWSGDAGAAAGGPATPCPACLRRLDRARRRAGVLHPHEPGLGAVRARSSWRSSCW